MRKQLVAFVAFAALAGAAQADPFAFTGPSADDVDTDPGTQVVLFAGTSGIITDINVGVWITGGFMEDFSLYLTSPSGTTVQFRAPLYPEHIDGPMQAFFDDEASAPHGDQVYGAIGTFTPWYWLYTFDGEELYGDWILTIEDEIFPGEGDDLVAWAITGDVSVPEPTLAALLGVGLAGVGIARRRRSRR
jgi:subtilisin-like proprotein convertase family protein